MPEVIVREASYPVPRRVVEEILDRFAPPLAGRRVLVKPNCLSAAPPERAVTTHPSLVAALVAALVGRGARVAVGDNPGARGYGAGRRCLEASGIAAAAGEHLVEIGRANELVPFGASGATRIAVARAVLEADYLVSVPKLKTHCLTLLTGAVKNMYGILAGAEKARLHAEARTPGSFADALADVLAVRPPDLAVVDAVTAMEGDGPSHGAPRQVGLVIASPDPVAADAVCARVMGVKPARVLHLRRAAARGLGTIDPARIAVDGPVRAVSGFRLPSTARRGLLHAVSSLVVFRLLHRSRLRVRRDRCTLCGECARACPSGAMVRRDGGYEIEQRRCHHCFCCHELCPSGAVTVRGALGALRHQG